MFALQLISVRWNTIKSIKNIHYYSFLPDEAQTIIPYHLELVRQNGQVYVFHNKFYDACNYLVGAKCPLEPGTYTFEFPTTVPKVTDSEVVTYTGMAHDKDFKPIICLSTKQTVAP